MSKMLLIPISAVQLVFMMSIFREPRVIRRERQNKVILVSLELQHLEYQKLQSTPQHCANDHCAFVNIVLSIL